MTKTLDSASVASWVSREGGGARRFRYRGDLRGGAFWPNAVFRPLLRLGQAARGARTCFGIPALHNASESRAIRIGCAMVGMDL
jgi:hypothetical protein